MSAIWHRAIVFAVVLAAVTGGLVYAFWPRPVPVDFAAVTHGTLQVTVDEEGEARIKDVFVVAAPLAGEVLRIDIEAGDPVEAGKTLLATIQEVDPTFLDRRAQSQAEAEVEAAQAALTLAEAELARAKAELHFAQADLDRARVLVERRTISQRALEQAELGVETRQALVDTAGAAVGVRMSELGVARAALIVPESPHDAHTGSRCCVDIRAPISGRVLRILHESQGVVAAGTPLLELGDPDRLEIVVDVLSTDAVKVTEGDEVEIVDWGGNNELKGIVRQVEPYGFTKVSALGIEEQRVNVIVDLVDPPSAWRSLGHGFRVRTRIVVWRGEDVTKVPVAALFRERDEWAVFVEAEGRAELRRISIGRRNDTHAQILDGLTQGERVVLHPSDRVEDGVAIIARSIE